jgi:hypothetical protein
MRRYQELIEHQMSKGNGEMYNMLNVKYFIFSDSTNRMMVQPNSLANGNAWFVKQIQWVPNADTEMDSMTHLNTKEAAVVDVRFKEQLGDFVPAYDSSANIKLTSYKPNELSYESNAAADQLAVFSDIYYDKGWNAYVDGKLAQHLRADYVLRAMKVPAGKHTIVFKFEPEIVATGERVALFSSLSLYAGILGIGAFMFFKKQKNTTT